MLLSDNISCIFQVPTIKTLSSLEEVKDPSFPFDVKLHFRQRPDHWKEVQAFRFVNKIHYTRDAETEYVKHKIELLNNDLSLYLSKYRDWETDRKSTRLNSSHSAKSRMPSSA